MSVAIHVATPVDVARLIEGLLLAAETAASLDRPLLAAAFTDLANHVGDALDRMPETSVVLLRTERARAHIARYLAEGEQLNGLARTGAAS